jgi:hypothetical protein
MISVKIPPTDQGLIRDTIGIFYVICGHSMGEPYLKDVDYKGQGILPVRDDKVREDGMCMPAGTEYTEDPDPFGYNLTIGKINDISFI